MEQEVRNSLEGINSIFDWNWHIMEQTRIGLIGVGRFCPDYHIPNLIQRRDVEITAVCDISQDRLDNLPESLCASQTSRDYRDLLDPDLVDGVVVSTPNQYHYEQCKLALERRIPVLVDKPTTVTVAHAKELTALSQSQECLLMTAFTRRFMASTEYVRSQLASSSDDIQYMRAVQRRAGGNLVDGGMLHTRTVHILDVLPWLVEQRIQRGRRWDRRLPSSATVFEWHMVASGERPNSLCSNWLSHASRFF